MTTKTILIADRNKHVRTVIQSRFAASGYRFVEAESGLNAIHSAAGLKIDVLILGDELPGEQIAVLREIRKEFEAPIIILSSQSREQFRTVVTKLSDVYYLSKPLDLRKLGNLLASLIGPDPRSASSHPFEMQFGPVTNRQCTARQAPSLLSH